MRARLEIAALYIAVGLGALTITLLSGPGALVPHPPYGQWIIGRCFALGALAGLGTILLFGLVDDLFDVEEPATSGERPIRWVTIRLAFLISMLASATFVGVSALVSYLDRSLSG